MKIVMICRQIKYGGGMEKVFCMLANNLVECYGEDVVVILEGSRFEDEYKLTDKVKIIALDEIRNSHGVIEAIAHNFSIYSKLVSAIKQSKPDVVLSFLPALATMCKIRFPHIKVIGSVRVNPKVDLQGMKNRILSIKGSKCLDGFIFLTQGARKCFPRKTSHKATVISQAVEQPLEWVDYNNLSKKRAIYASGRFAAGKRFDDIVKAFKFVHDIHPEYRLILFGDGEKRNDILRLVSELGLSSFVDMPGMVHNPMEKMINGYMYVFSSDSEGYPNALAEAMMIGLPCIATDCDFGPSDMINDGENGRLVPVGDIKAMSQAMNDLIENPQIAAKYSEKSIGFRKSHSVDRIMKYYYQYIRDVAGGIYDIPLTEKLWNKLSVNQYTIGWSLINDNNTLLKQKKVFKFIPLNGTEWYADPILYENNSVTYLFMEVYDLKKNKGCIAYSILSENGISKPKRIIEEEWHMSFPYIFKIGDELFMLPETNAINSLCFYKCVHFPDDWELVCKIENERKVSDSIVIERSGKYYIITPQKKEENGMFTRLLIGELNYCNNNFSLNRDVFRDVNAQMEYSLFTRNGGAPFLEGEKLIRVSQESTPIYYGVALRFFEIDELTSGVFKEHEIARIDLNDIQGDFPQRYHGKGIHTYGRTSKYEVIDMKVKSFRP